MKLLTKYQRSTVCRRVLTSCIMRVSLVVILLAGCEEKKTEDGPVMSLDEGAYSIKPSLPRLTPPQKIAPCRPKSPDREGLSDRQKLLAQARRMEMIVKRRLHSKSQIVTLKNSQIQTHQTHYQVDNMTWPMSVSSLKVDRHDLLTTDMVMRTVSAHDIHSANSGSVLLVLDSHVLSPSGQHVLLPAYTKVICHYEGLKPQGQTRLPLLCERLITPAGQSVKFEADGADLSGRSGLIGEIDNRLWMRYGGAMAMSGLSSTSQTANKWSKHKTFTSSAGQLSNQWGKITSKILEKNFNIPPVITIAAGTRIILRPKNDLLIKKYRLKPEAET